MLAKGSLCALKVVARCAVRVVRWWVRRWEVARKVDQGGSGSLVSRSRRSEDKALVSWRRRCRVESRDLMSLGEWPGWGMDIVGRLRGAWVEEIQGESNWGIGCAVLDTATRSSAGKSGLAPVLHIGFRN